MRVDWDRINEDRIREIVREEIAEALAAIEEKLKETTWPTG